jgi:alginate O-acetyltransferase complex protein AlgJ
MCSTSVIAGTPREKISQLAQSGAVNGVVAGEDGWLFLQEELEHLSHKTLFGSKMAETSNAAKPEFADPLPAIVDFNNQLKERNIELLFVPVPPKALIYPDKLSAELSGKDVASLQQPYQELYRELRKQGVHVVDLIPLYTEKSRESRLYCKTDSHFSGQGIDLVSKELTRLIKTKGFYVSVPKKKFKRTKKELLIQGDLTGMLKKETQESLVLEFVTDLETGKHIVVNKKSPVLLLGDSHALVFSVGGDLHTSGAGLFDILSADLGFPVDRIGVRGSGATPSRIKLYQRSRKDPQMLDAKKMVIWCLSSRELTGSGGWRKIPVAKK